MKVGLNVVQKIVTRWKHQYRCNSFSQVFLNFQCVTKIQRLFFIPESKCFLINTKMFLIKKVKSCISGIIDNKIYIPRFWKSMLFMLQYLFELFFPILHNYGVTKDNCKRRTKIMRNFCVILFRFSYRFRNLCRNIFKFNNQF